MSIVIESWYWRYRMLSERHEVVLSNLMQTNSFGQDGCAGTNLLRRYLYAMYHPGRPWS
ncbi:MAG: hypothetical protein QXI38_00890 [Conexivisphaerales archaeon]